MTEKAMFDFAIKQKEEWKRTNDDVYRIAWETARAMIEVSGLWNDWKEYIANKSHPPGRAVPGESRKIC